MRIGPDPTRPGLDTCRLRTPAWVLVRVRVCSILEPWDPTVVGLDPIRGVQIPFQGSGSHTWRSWAKPNMEVWTVYIGVQHESDTVPWGSGLTVDALGYITFSEHVASPDPPMWWGQALLLA
jgi:hypothetical protein